MRIESAYPYYMEVPLIKQSRVKLKNKYKDIKIHKQTEGQETNNEKQS